MHNTGWEIQSVAEGDHVLIAAVAVSILESPNPASAFGDGITGHFRNVHSAISVPSDRHWADNVRLAGDQIDSQLRVGEPKTAMLLDRRTCVGRNRLLIVWYRGFCICGIR